MQLVYYSHSYRPVDAAVVEYFGQLMRSEGLTPSLDPPSDRLNSAKPERHLRNTDGMIAVVTARDEGVSQYILYEISLCLRSHKPLLVFIEDVLPDDLIPARVLQRRFARKGLLRQIRDLRFAMRIMKSYIGSEPPPSYQPSGGRRSCLVVGLSEFPGQIKKAVTTEIERNQYTVQVLNEQDRSVVYDNSLQESITCSDLSICCVDTHSSVSQFVIGALRACLVPTIPLTADHSYNYHLSVPREYQPRFTEGIPSSVRKIIRHEISIFEEEYVDLKDQQEVAKYAQLVVSESSPSGSHSSDLRKVFVKEIVMGDKYSAGQAGAMGPGAHAHHMSFSQLWEQVSKKHDLSALQEELASLRNAMKEQSSEPEHDIAVGAVAEAESFAKKGEGSKVLEKLAQAGHWALDVATKIGASVAASAIKSSLGL